MKIKVLSFFFCLVFSLEALAATQLYARKIFDGRASDKSEVWRVYEVDETTKAIVDFHDFAVSTELTGAQKRASARTKWEAWKAANPMAGPF